MPLPVPQITDDNGAFWTGGRDGELLILRCELRLLDPPADAPLPEVPGRRCRAASRERAGHGLSYTINRQAWVPGLDVPFVIAMVKLDEQPGLRLMTNIVDCRTEEVEIGMPVEVAFVERGEAFIPVFHKVAA